MPKSIFQIKFDNTDGLHYELLASTSATLFQQMVGKFEKKNNQVIRICKCTVLHIAWKVCTNFYFAFFF